MSRETHVQFCERLGVRLPGATHLIVHCRAKGEAELVRANVTARLKQCGLELHPEKTKLVYCKDANRQQSHPNEEFDFLGYTFRPRAAVNRKGTLFCSFSPAISKNSEDRIRREITSWRLHLCNSQSIEELARKINPKFRGWINYYGRFNPSALHPIERHLGLTLARWASRKYKTLRRHRLRAWHWVVRQTKRQPGLLALWEQPRRTVFTTRAV